ncbi:GH32 C-terminal domain-containing protein [Paenibacillus alginolyticus]|uniref:GH32 C-terminal domain-containing protein n=1 Tax=Paenibacillus alginolyticus TaxID=59839 RepID=UPI0003FDE03B|nr:GH32 C-terminal domain-containing protein [Paenibacillus alginolyticus]MCY9663539.1 GH32 C-terminal domain-containing protein [Paenibacillus alginolyticus]
MRKRLFISAGSVAVVLVGVGLAFLLTNPQHKEATNPGMSINYNSNSNYYTEKFRPQYHLSPLSGNMSDPNGMVYFEGEYHQFYQNSGQWGHAVSKDLIHWEHLPVAMTRDSLGDIWSGSAVVDEKDTSGFFGGKPGLVAIFTHFKNGPLSQSQSIAYSSDKGRTWTKYAGNPVIPNPGLKDFRDPKVLWYEPTHSWVMIVSVDNRVRFYTSPDLKNWEMTGEFGQDQGSHAAVWECPDLFELPVEGTNTKKWILTVSIGSNDKTKGSTAQYFVGSFDGKTFKNDNKPSDVLWTDYGKDFYAAVSYSDIPVEDGRRIWVGWMSNWRYPFAMPTGQWKGNMSINRELKLREISGQGLRMVQLPVKELDALRGKPTIVSKKQLTPGAGNPFVGIRGTSYELDSEMTLQADAAFNLKLRTGNKQETVLHYDAKTSQLSLDREESGITSFEKGFAEKMTAPLQLKDHKIKLRIYVDESSVEVFAGDGESVISSIIFPDPTSNGLELEATEGTVILNHADVYPMRTIWRDEDPNGRKPLRIAFNKGILNLPVGGTEQIEASVIPLSSPQTLKWESSDTSVATVKATSSGAEVTGLKDGDVEIRATSQDGSIVSSINVYVTHKTKP